MTEQVTQTKEATQEPKELNPDSLPVEEGPPIEEVSGGLERLFEKPAQPEVKKTEEKPGDPKADAIVTQHDKQERHYVPLKKYVALEKEHKAQKQYLSQLETRIQARMQEAVQEALAQRAKPVQEAPNKEEDPQGWLVHQEEQRQRQERERQQEQEQQASEAEERQELLEYAKTHAEAWKEEHKDYNDRLNLLQERFFEQAIENGYTQAQAKQQGAELAYDVIKFSHKHGLNPAMFYHALADVVANTNGGVEGTMETELEVANPVSANEQVKIIQAGKQAAKTLGGSGGTSKKEGLTFADLQNMPWSEDKEKAMNRLIAKSLGRPYYE